MLVIGVQLNVVIIRAVDYIKYYLVLQQLNVIGIIISHSVVNTDRDDILRYSKYSCKILVIDIYYNSAGFIHSAAYFQLLVNKLRLCKITRILGDYSTCKYCNIKVCRLWNMFHVAAVHAGNVYNGSLCLFRCREHCSQHRWIVVCYWNRSNGFHLVGKHLVYHIKRIYFFGAVHYRYRPHTKFWFYEYSRFAERFVKVAYDYIRYFVYSFFCDYYCSAFFKCGDCGFLCVSKISTARLDFLPSECKWWNRYICGIAKLCVKHLAKFTYSGDWIIFFTVLFTRLFPAERFVIVKRKVQQCYCVIEYIFHLFRILCAENYSQYFFTEFTCGRKSRAGKTGFGTGCITAFYTYCGFISVSSVPAVDKQIRVLDFTRTVQVCCGYCILIGCGYNSEHTVCHTVAADNSQVICVGVLLGSEFSVRRCYDGIVGTYFLSLFFHNYRKLVKTAADKFRKSKQRIICRYKHHRIYQVENRYIFAGLEINRGWTFPVWYLFNNVFGHCYSIVRVAFFKSYYRCHYLYKKSRRQFHSGVFFKKYPTFVLSNNYCSLCIYLRHFCFLNSSYFRH